MERRAAGADRRPGRRPDLGGGAVLRIHVAVVGRLKEKFLEAAEAEYRKRLRPYCKLEVAEHRDEAALLRALPSPVHLYALDERGDCITSEQFARDVLEAEQLRGGGVPVAFAIGGADGHTDALRARATRLIAFGRMTLAHRLARLVLLEQIYRGFRIVRGEPYHRD